MPCQSGSTYLSLPPSLPPSLSPSLPLSVSLSSSFPPLINLALPLRPSPSLSTFLSSEVTIFCLFCSFVFFPLCSLTPLRYLALSLLLQAMAPATQGTETRAFTGFVHLLHKVSIVVTEASLRCASRSLLLAGNGIKFTDRGHVIVSAEVVHRSDTAVEMLFAINDSGEGVAAILLQIIFIST